MRPPTPSMCVSVSEWRGAWNRRLRPFLVKPAVRELYQQIIAMRETRRFGDLAAIGIGYVSGANEFFHLRPSEAEGRKIPRQFLHPSVRNGRSCRGIRNDVSRYEAVAFVLVDPSGPKAGKVLSNCPVDDSPLRVERFFETLYLRYDERYVYSAPDLKSVTRRREWSPKSPVFDRTLIPTYPARTLYYQPRIKAPDSTNEG